MDAILAAARNQSRRRRLVELGLVDHTAEVLQALAEQQPNLETALDEHSLCNPADPGKDAGRICDPGFVQRLLFE